MGGVAVEASLVLAAIPAIDSIAGLDGVVDRCRDALAPLTTDPGFVSWIALVAAAFVAVRVALGMWRASMRARAALVEPWLGDHSERDDFELVVLPTEELVAFGVSALRPQIVISRGLLEHLEPAHVEAVVEHEAAHHRLHHGAFLVVLAGCASAFGRLGFVYRSIETVRDGLELWADAEVGAAGDEPRAALRDALIGVNACSRNVGRGSAAAAQTEHRMRWLDRQVRPRSVLVRSMTYAPVVALGLATVMLMAGWLTEAHHAVALGPPCAH